MKEKLQTIYVYLEVGDVETAMTLLAELISEQ